MIFDRASYINEPVLIAKELKILFEFEPLTIFEIGACEGEDSIKYSRLFPNSKIYAFEPLLDNIKHIENNLRKYNITNISFYNLALSSEKGIAEFFVSQGKPEEVPESDWDYGNKSSSLLPPDKHVEIYDFIKFDKKIEVETTTIQHFCKLNNVSEIDFIHMDVQGAELMVLNGAGAFINSIKSIWLEVSTVEMYKNQPLAKDIKSFMKDNNFVLVKDCVASKQGDQLFISKTFFPDYKTLFPRANQSKKKYFFGLIKKIIRSIT